MRNQFFDYCFLFDFYNVRGSTATPSGHSNVSWCAFRKFWQFYSFLVVQYEKLNK